MPKNETGKNNKGTKKTTTKSNVSKKNNSVKKTSTKKPTNTTKKVEVKKETSKPVVNEKIIERKTTSEIETNGLMNNTPFVIALCIIVLLIAILIFTICSKRIPKTSNGNDIVASLNGKDITANELYEALKESYGTNSLLDLIDTYIASKEVKITDDDKDYAKEVVDYYKEYAEYYGVDLETFISNYLGIPGVSTEDEFFDYVLEDYKKTLAVKNYIADTASEDDLKKYYEENFSDKLTVRHILVEIDSEAEDQDAADRQAYDKAVELINQLNEVSENLESKFIELAENNSDDTTTYSNGGLMEDMTSKGIQESFFNAANNLKDGEYTKEPVKTSYGYHVIYKIKSTPVEKYEKIKDEVKNSYSENLISSDSNLKNIKWDELRSKYKMSIKDDIIKKAYEDAIKSIKKSDKEEVE